MEEELHVVLLESTVNHLLVELCTESTSCERLCLTTSEDRRAVRHWKWRNLAPDRTDLVSLTTVKTNTLIKDTTTHSVLLYIVIVFVSESILLLKLILCEVCVSSSILLLEFCDDSLESLCTSVLLKSLLNNVVSLLVALGSNLLLQLIVVNLVAVLTLLVSTKLLHKLVLELTHRLDSSVCSLKGIEKVSLLNLLHLTLNHHDVVSSSTYHKVHICLLHLFEGWVDNKLAIDASYTYLRDWALKWNI